MSDGTGVRVPPCNRADRMIATVLRAEELGTAGTTES
jgi:hypothetical protein